MIDSKTYLKKYISQIGEKKLQFWIRKIYFQKFSSVNLNKSPWWIQWVHKPDTYALSYDNIPIQLIQTNEQNVLIAIMCKVYFKV